MASVPSVWSLALALLLLVIAYARGFRRRPAHPPGPKPLPIIGNLLDVPKSKGHVVFKEWEKQYDSKLLYASVLGQSVLVINSLEDATELLEKRASTTSDRPWLPLMDLVGATRNTLLKRYGDSWRFHRRILHQNLRKGVLEHYRPILMQKSHILLHRLAQDPAEFLTHFKIYSSSLLMGVVYGCDMEAPDEWNLPTSYFEWAEKVIRDVSKIGLLPIIRQAPSWLLGGSQSYTADLRRRVLKLRDQPFDLAKEKAMLDDERLDMVSRVLRNKVEGPESSEEPLRDVSMSAWVAGVETTASALGSFILALCLCPDVQEKAQDEISRVVGSDRLPTLEDRPSLPYLEAIYREVLRWKPPAPQAVPHSTVQDDMYKGYFIPSGTIIIPNVWAMMRDEESYPEPEAFRPERYLKPDGTLDARQSDRVLAYGFGRRACPGKDLASESFWLGIAHILASFDIAKAKDKEGMDIPLTLEYFDDEAVVRPKPFPCSITARRSIDTLTFAG
ncbi:cytochrome P450 [Pluteus cervinus]|uniref:Cytochrome P450 n=1 Tax=Pluteus cervinus TaxID=181527 RepID=A0ACD3B5W6_9AGAR|nr:cytochrome P450 [Pluteus cervinus]